MACADMNGNQCQILEDKMKVKREDEDVVMHFLAGKGSFITHWNQYKLLQE